jgi:hypothetical protein
MSLSKWKVLIALLVATVALIGSAAAWDVLTQYGSATLGIKSGDVLSLSGATMFGTAASAQTLERGGNIEGGLQALFDNWADVGVSGIITASTAPLSSDFPIRDDIDPKFSAQIDTEDANIFDANLGQSATVGFLQIGDIGAVPTFSGDAKNWASFGTHNLDSSDIKDIEISVANKQDFSLTSAMK